MGLPYAPMLQRMLQEFQGQRLESAERIARAILNINSKDLTALQVQGLCMAMQGRFNDAASAFLRASQLDPKNEDLLTNLAKAQFAAENFDGAAQAFEKLNKLLPNRPAILTDLGTAYAKLRQYEKATVSYDKAIEIDPHYFLAWSNRGNLLSELGYPKEAISCFEKALQENSKYAESWTNLGNALFDLGRFDEAYFAHDKALALDHHYGEAWFNKGNALTELKQGESALIHYAKAFEIKPELPFLLGQYFNALALNCDWSRYEDLSSFALSQVANGKKAVSPFILLQTNADAALQKQAAEAYIQSRIIVTNSENIPLPNDIGQRKIRIGYFSTDFKNHPVGILMENLMRFHDRSKFDIAGYFLNQETGDDTEQVLINAFDSVHHIYGMNDTDAHRHILEHNIDIAIDLNGHTAGARTGIFARRIAPIQVNYLGFAGTMGANFYEYLIADQIAIPFDQQDHYTEKLAYLPHSFFPADTLISWEDFGPMPTRESQGLPESGFIFSCFNNSYKITPSIFRLWMNLLLEVEGSVLWLTRPSETAMRNLQMSASNIGVDPKRIIFAKREERRIDHLSRLRLIDLFLDTPQFNAHTTAADALWSGVPLLTQIGNTFAGRVAASQLHALGLNEMITKSAEEYQKKALELAKTPELLGQIRPKFENSRNQSPLFNSAQYVKDLEALYCGMLKA